jgi:hypothetical protein
MKKFNDDVLNNRQNHATRAAVCVFIFDHFHENTSDYFYHHRQHN